MKFTLTDEMAREFKKKCPGISFDTAVRPIIIELEYDIDRPYFMYNIFHSLFPVMEEGCYYADEMFFNFLKEFYPEVFL